MSAHLSHNLKAGNIHDLLQIHEFLIELLQTRDTILPICFNGSMKWERASDFKSQGSSQVWWHVWSAGWVIIVTDFKFTNYFKLEIQACQYVSIDS